MVQFTNSFSHKGERFTSVSSFILRGQSVGDTKDESLRSLGSSGSHFHNSMSSKVSYRGSERSIANNNSSTSDIKTDCLLPLGRDRAQRSVDGSRRKSYLLRHQSSTNSKVSMSDLEVEDKDKFLGINGTHQSLERPTSKYSDPEYWNKRYGKSLYIWHTKSWDFQYQEKNHVHQNSIM